MMKLWVILNDFIDKTLWSKLSSGVKWLQPCANSELNCKIVCCQLLPMDFDTDQVKKSFFAGK